MILESLYQWGQGWFYVLDKKNENKNYLPLLLYRNCKLKNVHMKCHSKNFWKNLNVLFGLKLTRLHYERS